MSNPLFDQIGGQQAAPQQQMTLQQAAQSIQRNPQAFLRQMNLNVPDGMTDPQQLAKYLVSSGQRSNSLLQMLMSRMGR